MPDGTSRFSYRGQMVHHYMGTSTFSNFTVLPEIAVAKIRDDAPFQTSCYVGCGVTTGVGAVTKTAKVQAGDNVVRSEEHTSELQSRQYLVCRLLLEKKKQRKLADSSSDICCRTV